MSLGNEEDLVNPFSLQTCFFFLFFIIIIIYFYLFIFFFANRIDPDETAHNELSHQDLHCLLFRFDFHMTSIFAIMDMPKVR